MDTSEKYIEMCRAADEIQKIWKAEVGDYVFPPKTHPCQAIRILCSMGELSYPSGYSPYRNKQLETWLPRQDQLQDMIKPKELVTQFGVNQNLWGVLFEFDMFVMNERYYNPKRYSTMEQLWLAYVMYEKYEKIWDESEWK